METEQPELAPAISAENILGNAASVKNWLHSRSDEIEESRKLPSDVVDILFKVGVFRMNMPVDWGGPELTSMEQVSIIETLSMADASAGWCAMIGSDSGLYSGYLDDEVARNLYAYLDVVQAGWVYPVGVAEEVEGGYKISGNWMFCSGSSHADVIGAGCIVHKDGKPLLDSVGQPTWRVMLAPAGHWRIEDNWHTTGLKGTASNDYTTLSPYLVVPEEHSFSFKEPKREGILWRGPDAQLRKMSGVPLGVARQAIDEFAAIMENKTHRLSGSSYLKLPRVQLAIAEAEMMLGSARSYVYSSLEKQWRILEEAGELSDQIRADVWLSRLNAFQVARNVTRLLYDAVGADAVFTRLSSLDRAVRDSETMCQHWVAQKAGLESIGGMILGVETIPPRSIMI